MSRPMKIRLVFFTVSFLVMLGIVLYAWGERRLAAEHDRIIVELVDAGEYRQAVEELEPLVDRAGLMVHDQIQQTLAVCYVAVGDDPGLSFEEAASWYRKAEAIDPSLIDDRRQQLLDNAE